MSNEADWLRWSRRLGDIAQAGLTYADDNYDIERYREIRTIAAELAAAHSSHPPEAIEQLFASHIGHPTPKIDVRAAIIVDGRILLVRERSDGGWTLPGGWADPGEPPSIAVARETREEAGVEVRAVKLMALYDRALHNHPPSLEYIYKAFFICEPIGVAHPQPSEETDGADFFDPTDLPNLSTSRTTAAQIQRAFAHYGDPALATDFD